MSTLLLTIATEFKEIREINSAVYHIRRLLSTAMEFKEFERISVDTERTELLDYALRNQIQYCLKLQRNETSYNKNVFFSLSILQSLLYYGMTHAHLQKQRDKGVMSAVIQ